MEWLKNFVLSFFEHLYYAFVWVMLGSINFFMYTLFCIYDGLLFVVLRFFSVVDYSVIPFNFALQYSSLPPQLIWLLNQVNVPQGLSYISLAISVRLVLNLVPASLTRV